AAAAGKADLAQSMNRTGQQPDILARQEIATQQQRQYVDYEINRNLTRADELIANHTYNDAQAAISSARVARNTNPGIFTDEEFRAFDQRIADAQTRLDQSK